MQDVSVQSAKSKSFYVFLAVSIVCALFSLLAGALVIVNLYKILDLPTADAFYCIPVTIGCVGIIFGFIAQEKARNTESSPQQGCAINFTIYFNLIILVLYVVFLLGSFYLFAQSRA